MAIDFGRAARGIATGYLTAKVADTAQRDKQNGLFIQAAAEKYFNEDKPQFVADEKLRHNNFLTIKRDKGLAFAQYADSEAGGFATTSLNATKNFLNTVKELRPEQIKVIESNYSERKKGRVQTFNEKNAYLKEYFKSLPGGLADNVLEIQLPDEGKDVSVTGIKQGDTMKTTTQEPTTGLMDINNVSGVYDLNKTEHRQLERIAAGQFNQLFFDRNTQRFNFTISGDKKSGEFIDSRYPTVQLLKKGYSDAVKQGYEFGFEVYARDKFVQLVMDSRDIKGYQGTLPPEKIETKAEETKTEIKAAPGDGQKFDAPDVSKIGVKEGVNEKSRQVIDGKVVSYTDASDSINKLREAISKISNSNILSDDQKEKNIDIARERTRQKIIEMGLDPDKFSF